MAIIDFAQVQASQAHPTVVQANLLVEEVTRFIANNKPRSCYALAPFATEIKEEVVEQLDRLNPLLAYCNCAYRLSLFFTELFNQIDDDRYRATWNRMSQNMADDVVNEMAAAERGKMQEVYDRIDFCFD